jgi:hypothetical protein
MSVDQLNEWAAKSMQVPKSRERARLLDAQSGELDKEIADIRREIALRAEIPTEANRAIVIWLGFSLKYISIRSIRLPTNEGH